MGANLYVALPPFPGHDPDHLAPMAQRQHLFSGAFIEGLVKPFDERRITRICERALDRPAVDLFLQVDMGRMFLLQRTTPWIGVKVTGECPFNVARAGVVAFDTVGVVAVHHPHHRGQIGQGTGRQVPAQTARRLNHPVCRLDQVKRDVIFEPRRLYP